MANTIRPFTCADCTELNRKYIGDGFDEFYEWTCGATENKTIACVDTFDPMPKIPTWCPRIKATADDIWERIKEK